MKATLKTIEPTPPPKVVLLELSEEEAKFFFELSKKNTLTRCASFIDGDATFRRPPFAASEMSRKLTALNSALYDVVGR